MDLERGASGGELATKVAIGAGIAAAIRGIGIDVEVPLSLP